MGLKEDGSVVVTGLYAQRHQVHGSDYVAVAAGDNAIIALRSDGTLVWDASFETKNVPAWDTIHTPR